MTNLVVSIHHYLSIKATYVTNKWTLQPVYKVHLCESIQKYPYNTPGYKGYSYCRTLNGIWYEESPKTDGEVVGLCIDQIRQVHDTLNSDSSSDFGHYARFHIGSMLF